VNYQTTPAQREFYNENGYLLIEDVFTEHECHAFNIAAEEAVDGNITVTSGIHRKSDAFLKLLKNERILGYADSLLDWRMIPVGSIFFFAEANNPKESGSCPHQDNFAPRAPYGSYLACGVAFDDADSENGALIVYPGTHKLGDLPCSPKENFEYDDCGEVVKALPIGNNCEIPDGYDELQLSYKKGSIIFFHAHLVHWAPKNVSTNPDKKYRRVVYCKYIKNGDPFWPGWTDRRELIDRDDSISGAVEFNVFNNPYN